VTAGRADEAVTALYLHFGVTEEFIGAGRSVFMDNTLVKWRELAA